MTDREKVAQAMKDFDQNLVAEWLLNQGIQVHGTLAMMGILTQWMGLVLKFGPGIERGGSGSLH